MKYISALIQTLAMVIWWPFALLEDDLGVTLVLATVVVEIWSDATK